MSEGRIVVVGHTRAGSGAELVLVRYVDAIQAADQCAVSAICPDGRLAQWLDERGIPITVIPELGLPAGPKPVAAARMTNRWARAGRQIRRATNPSDTLVVNGLSALPAVRAAGRADRAVWLVHDVVTRYDRRLIGRLGARTFQAAIAVSHAAAVFPTHVGVPTFVVANGTHWPVDPAEPFSGRPIVGINGALTPWKGHEVLLEAMAGLPDVDVEILGAGFAKDQPYVDQLQARATHGDLHGRVRFVGHVDDPLAAMRRWAVAVSASVEPEAAPLAVLEAMSLGLPVVASDHGGGPEVLDGTGLVYPPASPAALRQNVALLLDDDELRCRKGRAARRRIASDLTLEQAEQRFVDLLFQLHGAGL